MNKKEKGDLLKLVYKYEEQIKAQDELLEKVLKLTKDFHNSYGRLMFIDRLFTRFMMIAIGLTTLLLGETFILSFSIFMLIFLLIDSIRELKRGNKNNGSIS